MAVTWAQVRAIAATFPGAEERTSYGTPAFFLRKALFVRLHQKEDALVLNADLFEREILVEAEPMIYYFTDHYRAYPLILARLSMLSNKALAIALRRSYAHAAAKQAAKTRRRED